jgi:hypothetical protein
MGVENSADIYINDFDSYVNNGNRESRAERPVRRMLSSFK